MSIEVLNLSKRFDKVVAADNVSITVPQGSLTALLGPSGSGKTTVLRSIAGLEVPDSGEIRINGDDVTSMPARDRNIGFVFQHYALFKHMSVADNIRFPLKVRGWNKQQMDERVNELLGLFRLDGLHKRYPSQISGGQRQRVAFARALASHPKVLLLDEPFSALDARVREELRDWLRAVHDQLHVTSVFVTHDQAEAMEIAEKIVIMHQGKVEQTGAPQETFESPENPFVMNFLGKANALQGTASQGVARFGTIEVNFPAANGSTVPVVGYVRPHHLTIGRSKVPGSIEATVVRVVGTGSSLKVQLNSGLSDEPLVAEVQHLDQTSLNLSSGDVVYAVPTSIRVFSAE